MKKRSLFAAVAMLIVSAIVLTSATYAWFAASSTATVTGFSASVTNSDGSLMVSGDNDFATWGYTIAAADIGTNNKAVATNLVPVSVTPNYNSTGDYKVVGGAFGQGSSVWTGRAAAAGTDYTTYTFKVKSTVDATITGSLTSLNVQKNYLRAAIYVDGELKQVYGAASAAAYEPIQWTSAYETTPSSLTGTDADDDWIMDWTDASNNEGVPLEASYTGTSNNATFTFSATTDTEYEVVVLIWAEGQDPNCVGSASGEAISFGISLSK